ncbi:hypothetical protein NZK35_27115 [Stieleria sp. ICT_E10.1]|nr:hypothetical protein [Stieleria sedimenti]
MSIVQVYHRRTAAISRRRRLIIHFKTLDFAARLHRIVPRCFGQ